MAAAGAGRNRVRIIGGEHRGRLIAFPDQAGLRPTSDRVRETLFNWLQPVIEGSHCLDLFAGSGALGFEAASRGAAKVVMIETSPQVAATLEKNAAQLGLTDRVRVLRADALSWLTKASGRFDIVFVDPPFADGLVPAVVAALTRPGLLGAGALVYIEQDAHEGLPPLPDDWDLFREKRAGQVAYRLIRTGVRNADADPD